MKTVVLRNPMYADIEKYIRNAERGRLPFTHDGADVTLQITAEQVAKFFACKNCQMKPTVFIPFKKQLVGMCDQHWEGLAETVIGWSEEACVLKKAER
jgi:hypothetical protein